MTVRESIDVKSCPPRSRHRRGFGLVELAISVVMLATIVTLVARIVDGVARQRITSDRRAFAIRVLQNVMEDVSVDPASVESPDFAARHVGTDVRSALPEVKLTARAEAEAAPIARTRVTLELTWLRHDATPDAPARLVAWFPNTRGDRK